MITIYERDATDFSTNGLGTLNPTSCTVSETMNGSYEVTLIHPIDEKGKFSRIQEERVIRVPVPVGKTPYMSISGSGTAAREIYRVKTGGERLHLRNGASFDAKIIGKYAPGTEVVVIDRMTSSQWSEVTTPDGKHGWMWTGNLEYVRTETSGEAAEEGIKEAAALRDQPFRIYKVEPTLTGITAYARHIFYDLMDNMVASYKLGAGATGANAFLGLAGATEDEHGFTFYSDLESTAEDVEIIDKNPAEAILDDGGLIENYGGELQRDWWDVYLAKRIGEETDIQIREGKNLLGVKYSIDLTNTVTRIIPRGEDEEGNPLYLPGRYMENPTANKPVYVNHKYGVIEVKEAKIKTKGEEKRTEAECIELMEKAAKEAFEAGCDLPDVTLNVDFIDCAETEEYKQYRFLQRIHMGDTVKVIAKRVGVEVAMRMTQYSYDCLMKKYIKMTLGTIDATIEGNMINPRSIGSGTIRGSMIKLGGIGTGALADGAVNSMKIALAAIGYAHIGQAAIDQLAADAIAAIRADIRELVAGNITTDQLYADLAQIAVAQITAANIEKANIQWAEIASLTAAVAVIASAEIAKAKIDWAQIENVEISTADIKDLTAKVAEIVVAEIGEAKINWAQIVDVKIGTAQIEDAAITAAKIALGTITSALIANGAIGTAQIADGSITEAKIVSLNADVITSGTLSTERLLIKGAGGLFYEINATAGGLTAAQLTEEQYKNAISGTALVAHSVTADKIAAKSITANEIMSGTITAAEINVSSLFASDAVIAELDNYVLRTQTIEAIEGALDVWASNKIRLAVDNVQIGGTNMLRLTSDTISVLNGAVDPNWSKSWYCKSGIGIILMPHDLEYNAAHFETMLQLTAGEYMLSFWCWTYQMDAQPTVSCNLFSGTAGIDHYFKDIQPPANTPTRYEIPVTVKYDATVNLRLLTWTKWTTGELYFSDLKFEKGTKATDWSPAPEDVEAEIAKLSAELVVQAGEINANATKIETVNQSAANAQNTANAAQNTANSAQNQANTNASGLTAVAQRVTTAEMNISAMDGRISAKVEQTEFDALGNTVAQQGSEIAQTEKEVLILAGRTVGGTNMLKNTRTLRMANHAFDSSGASAMGSYEEDEYGGFHIWCNSSNVRWWLASPAVTPGQSYAMSIRYKMNSGEAPIQLQYIFRDSSFNVVTDGYQDSNNIGTVSTTIEDGWTVLKSVFTVPENAQIVYVHIAVRTGVDGAIYTCDYNIRRPKFEAGSMATDWSQNPEELYAGSSVKITEDEIRMVAPKTFIGIPSADGETTVAQFDENGLTADWVNANNVAYRYNGPANLWVKADMSSDLLAQGGHYRSLTEALNALNGKQLTYNVIIDVQSDIYGDASLSAASGCGITINGNGHTLYGSILAANSSCSMDINGLVINRPSSSGNPHALYLYRFGYVSLYQCTFIGGADTAVNIAQGTKVFMHDCELRGADKLIYLWYNAELQALYLKGGDCTYYLIINGATARWGGTRPDGVHDHWNQSLLLPADPNALPIDYGTATPTTPTIMTAAYDFLYADNYAGGWSAFGDEGDEDVRQGYNGNRIYGVIWFDAAAIRSALTGKTINQASLRLKMQSGVGRGVAVSVQLYGSNVSHDRTTVPALTTSYGTIGSTTPGEVNEITIPTAAITDMVNGTTQALVLYSDDMDYYSGRGYSRNYAKFDGSISGDASTRPRLTVVYQ